MKMSENLFIELKSDCMAVCNALDLMPEDLDCMADAWNIFHNICFDRHNDDTHPAFSSGVRKRILPYDKEGSIRFLDKFYKEEDLIDTNIATALRKIFPNTSKN